MDIGSLYPCPHTTGGKSKAKKGTAKQTKQSKHKKIKEKNKHKLRLHLFYIYV